MHSHKPIFTEHARCQDCYKCLRGCRLKAIRIEHECAAVIPDRCVYCGDCVSTCPVGAKKVRADLPKVRLLFRHHREVYASLAPSWVAEWPDLDAPRMIAALRKLGFTGVSETALGAEEVSAATAAMLATAAPGVYLSTACPSVVETVRRHLPELAPTLMPLLSPMLAHARLLRRLRGDGIGVVFLGPCISKKLEADEDRSPADAALTFAELRAWMVLERIDPYAETPEPEDAFFPERASDGGRYPLDGGMVTTVQSRLPSGCNVQSMSFSGLHGVLDALQGLAGARIKEPLFLELLACEGGCLNGPGMTRHCGTTVKALEVLERLGSGPSRPMLTRAELAAAFAEEPVVDTPHSEAEILKALRRVGKFSVEDEINCGGCGYDSCRLLAGALMDGRAEAGMCVSYMRKLAMNKANALIRAMPAGVVLVDDSLSIVECNRRFADMMGEEAQTVFETVPGMGGASLKKVAPELVDLLDEVLDAEDAELTRNLRLHGTVIKLQAFPIEPGVLACAILQDITEPAFQREQIILKAQDVIRKNVQTVQQIAYLLGENAADSEMILNSIVESFSIDDTEGRT